MASRVPTMRELLQLAREKFGPDATRYKTREELLEALGRDAAQHPPDVAAPPPAQAPRPSAPRPSAPRPELPLVTRNFFLDPE